MSEVREAEWVSVLGWVCVRKEGGSVLHRINTGLWGTLSMKRREEDVWSNIWTVKRRRSAMANSSGKWSVCLSVCVCFNISISTFPCFFLLFMVSMINFKTDYSVCEKCADVLMVDLTLGCDVTHPNSFIKYSTSPRGNHAEKELRMYFMTLNLNDLFLNY